MTKSRSIETDKEKEEKMSVKYGYARVSTADQNLAAQLTALREYGCTVIRQEKKSGTSLDNRPELNIILDFIQKGDYLVATRIDRIARSMYDLVCILKRLRLIGAYLVFTETPDIDTSSSHGDFVTNILGITAQFETNLRRDRQREGIAEAKRRGVYKGSVKKIKRDEIAEALRLGLPKSEIARQFKCNRSSVYRIESELKREQDKVACDK